MWKSPYFLAGVLAWAIAVYFAQQPTVRINGPVAIPASINAPIIQNYDVVNVTSAATAFGFSIAGGCCFLGAGLAGRNLIRGTDGVRAESAST